MGGSTESRQEAYGVMLRQVNRLERLIGDLLDVSQIEAGKTVVDPRTVELVSIVDRSGSSVPSGCTGPSSSCVPRAR